MPSFFMKIKNVDNNFFKKAAGQNSNPFKKPADFINPLANPRHRPERPKANELQGKPDGDGNFSSSNPMKNPLAQQ